MLISVKEYAAKMHVSPSTVQRRLSKGELRGKRFGRIWYVELTDAALQPQTRVDAVQSPAATTAVQFQESGIIGENRKSPAVSELIAFSSKALNSYLMMSDRLLLEKERIQQQQLEQLQSEKQRVAELQAYVALLEKMLFSDRADRSHSAAYATSALPVQRG